MKHIGAYEAKTNLSKLLDRVINGERITITKHGVPVALLQPYSPSQKQEPGKVIAELRKFRENHALKGLSLPKMVEDGRR